MILICGHAEFPSTADRDLALSEGAELQRATREEESGCLEYAFAADPVDGTRVVILEIWEDAPSLDAHFMHSNYFEMQKVMASHGVKGGDIWKYRCDLKGKIYDDTPRARADFFDS